MKMSTLVRVLGLTLVVLALVAGPLSAQDWEKHLVTSSLSGDIPTLDPSLATDNSSIRVLLMTHPGLAILDDEANLDYVLAESWDVSEDGKTYTFHIRQGIPWVKLNVDTGEFEQVTDESGNVRYVTANDFAYGIKRTLDPATAADYAYIMQTWIEGGAEYNPAEGVEDVGVEVVDDYTLTLTSPVAAAFLPNVYGMWMAAAQPQWAVEEFGEFWTEPENFQSYGPYALYEWNHDEDLTIVRNPFWPGTPDMPIPAIDAITWTMLDESAQMANYEAGTQQLIDGSVPLSELDRIRADATLSEELSTGPSPYSYYYGFNVEKEPFTNRNIRLAFSLAINRQALIDNVLKGGQLPARWFTQPNVAGAPTLETHPDLGVEYNVEAAQAALQTGLEELGLASIEDLPPITLMFNTSEGHARIAQAIQQMWTENLGVQVELANQEWAVYLETVDEDAPQIFRMAWGYDYPDANSYLNDVFHSGSANNYTNWESPEFDALIEEAMGLTDNTERQALYAQAEEMLVDEVAAIAPIYWYTALDLTKACVQRTFGVTGHERFDLWDMNCQ